MPNFRILLRKYVLYGRHLNLFANGPPTTDQHQITNQVYSTRIFILTLLLSLIILTIYTSSVTVIHTITKHNPSLQQYLQLYDAYPSTLNCPCTQTSTQYKTLLSGHYTLHQVCSSVFVTDLWIDYLIQARGFNMLYNTDFRISSLSTFPTLSSLCRNVNDTIKNSLLRFYANVYVTSSIIPQEIFQTHVQSFVNQFWLLTVDDFLSSLQIVQNYTQTNSLLSALLTNGYLSFVPGITIATMVPCAYDGCHCSVSAWCKVPSSIYNDTSYTPVFRVPGMYTGCYIFESLLQSTLECFYNQSCFDKLQSAMSPTIRSNATILDPSLASNYSIHSTVSELLASLMVEEWQWTTKYDQYYEACHPTECQYTVVGRNDAIYIVTTVIGLIGGLVTALKIIVPLLVILVNRKKIETRQRTSKTIYCSCRICSMPTPMCCIHDRLHI